LQGSITYILLSYFLCLNAILDKRVIHYRHFNKKDNLFFFLLLSNAVTRMTFLFYHALLIICMCIQVDMWESYIECWEKQPSFFFEILFYIIIVVIITCVSLSFVQYNVKVILPRVHVQLSQMHFTVDI